MRWYQTGTSRWRGRSGFLVWASTLRSILRHEAQVFFAGPWRTLTAAAFTKVSTASSVWPTPIPLLVWWRLSDGERYRQEEPIFRLRKEQRENGNVRNEPEIGRIKELLKLWDLANPEPEFWFNSITGDTWGSWLESGKRPAANWSPKEYGV